MPISVSSGHFALRYEVPKFLPRGGHLCMAVLTIAAAYSYCAGAHAALDYSLRAGLQLAACCRGVRETHDRMIDGGRGSTSISSTRSEIR